MLSGLERMWKMRDSVGDFERDQDCKQCVLYFVTAAAADNNRSIKRKVFAFRAQTESTTTMAAILCDALSFDVIARWTVFVQSVV